MNGKDAASKWEDRFEESDREIANMDSVDFMTLLIESRIIQPS